MLSEHIQAYISQEQSNGDYNFFTASFDADGLMMTGMDQPDKRITWSQWITFSRQVLIPFIRANGEDIKMRLVNPALLQ